MKLCRLVLGLALCLTLCACAPEPGPAAGDPDPKTAMGQEQPEEPPVQPVSPEKPSDWAPSEPEQRIDPWAIQEKRFLTVRVVDEEGNPSPNISVTVGEAFKKMEGISVTDSWGEN